MKDFDFDRLTDIARTQPALFEEYRQRLLAQAVERSRNPARLASLQRRLDGAMAGSAASLDACMSVSELMVDSISELRGEFDKLLA